MLQNRQAQPLFSASATVFDKLLSLDQLKDLYRTASSTDGFHQNLLTELQVSPYLDERDLARIPRTGPLVVVANHPFGMLEGSLLGTVLPQVRQDYKIMTNQLLACMPELASNCIFVDPFENKNASRNSRALRESVRWLRDGHMLVMFPAGEVSHWSLKNKAVEDPQWNSMVARLIRMTQAAALPLFFKGINSIPFQVLGLMHPRLRTARLPHELFNKRGKTVEIRVGSVIPFSRIESIPDDREATAYLRWRTYLLSNRGPTRGPTRGLLKQPKPSSEPIANPTPQQLLMNDLSGLRPEQMLEESREFSVYLAEASQIPNLMRELGRLREITFRQVGEGTGKVRDLDSFDDYYQHLVLWNKAKSEIVGAYRVGNADRILSRYGIKGLYTSTLFHYDPAFFRRIGPALELGRSFVRLEYQKKFAPLMLLWKGLARHVSRHPEAPVLFGAVSISNDYNPASRQLVARFLEERQSNEKLAHLVRARQPFPHKIDVQGRAIRGMFQDVEWLSEVIPDLETDRKGMPVLLTQYLKLGGKILAFNLDPRFVNALDGLVVVDLRETHLDTLERYMGAEAAATFLLQARTQPLGLSA